MFLCTLFFFFSSQGCENTCWKTQNSPTTSRISSCLNLKKHQIFVKYFVHIKNKTPKTSNKSILQERRQKRVSASYRQALLICFHLKLFRNNYCTLQEIPCSKPIIFQIQICTQNRWKKRVSYFKPNRSYLLHYFSKR